MLGVFFDGRKASRHERRKIAAASKQAVQLDEKPATRTMIMCRDKKKASLR
jgi:hypothetical protein